MINKFTEIKAPVKYLPNEKFAELKINSKSKYLISTKGRIYSYFSNRIITGKITSGVRCFDFVATDKKNTLIPYSKKVGNMKPQKNGRISVTIQRLVALVFLKKPKNAFIVIHKNYDKLDNSVENLQWVSDQDLIKNSKGSFYYKNYKVYRNVGHKLNSEQVLEIKKMLLQKKEKELNITICKIAETFNVSPMQIYRIQNGDLWPHIGSVIKQKQKQNILDKDIVSIIKIMLKNGDKGIFISKKLNIPPTTISRIKNNKYYK